MLHIQTAVVNNPTFIELQLTTLKFFVEGDYDFTVFNDAKDWPDFSNFGNPTLRREIQRTCERLNIPCIMIDNSSHRYKTCAANRCADANTAMLNYQRETSEKYLVLDSDMFPIAKFNARKYEDVDAAVVYQHAVNGDKAIDYFWNGIYYFNMTKLVHKNLMSWKCDDNNGVWTDVGGGMYRFLQESEPVNKIYKIDHLVSLRWNELQYPLDLDLRWLEFMKKDPRNKDGNFYSEIYDKTFLHFRAGGNWEKLSEETYNAPANTLKDVVYSVCRA